MWFILLSACIVSTDLYYERRAELTDDDSDGASEFEGDCDDADPSISPDSDEVCDGIDNNCDGFIDEDDAVDAGTWHIDVDGDGYGDGSTATSACSPPLGWADNSDDCDDTDATIKPSAVETWYDGIDQDCAGDDDYDADADGEIPTAYGGGDCDDDDPTRHSTAAEGWTDNGIDNNCDGQIYDELVVRAAEISTVIHGTDEGENFGAALLYLDEPWTGGSPMLLAASAQRDDGRGGVFGWSIDTLMDQPLLSDADWNHEGSIEDAFAGMGMSWAGSASAPVTLLAEPGPEDGRILGWTRPLLSSGESEPDFEIESAPGSAGLLGLYMNSGIDRDGDGVYEAMIPAHNESYSAATGGTIYFFDDLSSASGIFSTDDADAVVSCADVGGRMIATPVGDFDGDGLVDIGFTLQLPNQMDIAGGLLVTDSFQGVTEDVQDLAEARFFGGPFSFSTVQDIDGNGRGDIHVTSGNIYSYEAPLSGSFYPDADAPVRYALDPSSSDYATAAWTDLPNYTSRRWLMSASPQMDNLTGRVRLHPLSVSSDQYLADAPLQLQGTAPGDGFGLSALLVDLEDGYSDALVIGAAGVDVGAQDAGAVYIVPGPR